MNEREILNDVNYVNLQEIFGIRIRLKDIQNIFIYLYKFQYINSLIHL